MLKLTHSKDPCTRLGLDRKSSKEFDMVSDFSLNDTTSVSLAKLNRRPSINDRIKKINETYQIQIVDGEGDVDKTLNEIEDYIRPKLDRLKSHNSRQMKMPHLSSFSGLDMDKTESVTHSRAESRAESLGQSVGNISLGQAFSSQMLPTSESTCREKNTIRDYDSTATLDLPSEATVPNMPAKNVSNLARTVSVEPFVSDKPAAGSSKKARSKTVRSRKRETRERIGNFSRDRDGDRDRGQRDALRNFSDEKVEIVVSQI